MEALQTASNFDCLLPDRWQKRVFFLSQSLFCGCWGLFSSCFIWKGEAEQQKGCFCFSWLWQFGSGGLWGGKGGDYNVCMQMERLLTKHMSCWLQRSRPRAKPGGQGEDTFLETQRETQNQEAVQAPGLQSIWKQSSFWMETEYRGKICFPNFCLSASSLRLAFVVF